jgi:type IV secretory pathway VirJ component
MNGRLSILAALFLVAACWSQHTLDIRGRFQQLHRDGSRGGDPIILSSGDLGWVGLVVHVAELLAGHGYYVIGLNSKAYLASFTTKDSTLAPGDVPQDYAKLIEYAGQNSAAKPVLAGISEGAGLFLLAAGNPAVKGSIRRVLGLGLPDENELGWKWQDFTIWITNKKPNEPGFMVEDIISAVSPLPLAEIQSTHGEFISLEKAKAMFSQAGNPKKMW